MSSPAETTAAGPGLRPVRGTAAEVLALLGAWEDTQDPAPLVVETSGSTGAPKRVVLSRAAMRASADATHARLGGPGQWVLALPPTYVAGLQVLFRSVRAGTDPVVVAGDPSRMPDERLDVALDRALAGVAGPRCYVSLVPTQLHRVLARPGAGGLARADAVLVGGASLDPALRAAAERAGAPVVTTYGMSETCGGCVYDGVPLDGVEVGTTGDGRLRIRGPVLFDGYQDDPGLTNEVLRDGWFLTQDHGRVDGSGRVLVQGRVDDVVVSGGVNVPAGAVAEVLRRHPQVRAVEVVGVPDPEWGQVVVAVAVTTLSLDQLRDHVAAELRRAFAPRRLVTVGSLPLLPHGKVDRLAVRRLAGG